MGSRTVKINIDKFNNIKSFELFIFNYIKKLVKNIIPANIYVYSYEKNIEIINNISQTLLKLYKINNDLEKRSIYFKFIGFPYCILRDKKVIDKFFLNKLTFNLQELNYAKNTNCLKCKYITCLRFNNKNFKPKSFFAKDLISINEIYHILYTIHHFLLKLGIDKEKIIFALCFDYKNEKLMINRELLNRASIFINDYVEKLTHIFLINKINIDDGKYRNLFLKNYIKQKKFDNLLYKFNLSLDLGVLDSSYYKLIRWNEINVFMYEIENLNMILKEGPDISHRVQVGDTINGTSDCLDCDTITGLKVIHISSINKIKNNLNLDKYIVLVGDGDINLYIPLIYKFKYFITYSDRLYTAHYSIVLREIGAIFIEGVKSQYFYGINDKDILEVDFNKGIIKRIG